MQPILFGLFLSMYMVTVLGNLLIILAICSDCFLHTPMHCFLSNLSLADICSVSTTVPKIIVDIQTHSRVPSRRVVLFTLFVELWEALKLWWTGGLLERGNGGSDTVEPLLLMEHITGL
ncbi:Olfactory receptor 7A17 [Heterocephalus glaber]|uniref:Olfactory receptor 7A17 n=1 Tax=Heterocephalus glaber TaxID=10181 RepID=G5B102_HETGA|nr:Olfactory receptor 7A17 [Heterocephalus glaber]